MIPKSSLFSILIIASIILAANAGPFCQFYTLNNPNGVMCSTSDAESMFEFSINQFYRSNDDSPRTVFQTQTEQFDPNSLLNIIFASSLEYSFKSAGADIAWDYYDPISSTWVVIQDGSLPSSSYQPSQLGLSDGFILIQAIIPSEPSTPNRIHQVTFSIPVYSPCQFIFHYSHAIYLNGIYNHEKGSLEPWCALDNTADINSLKPLDGSECDITTFFSFLDSGDWDPNNQSNLFNASLAGQAVCPCPVSRTGPGCQYDLILSPVIGKYALPMIYPLSHYSPNFVQKKVLEFSQKQFENENLIIMNGSTPLSSGISITHELIDGFTLYYWTFSFIQTQFDSFLQTQPPQPPTVNYQFKTPDLTYNFSYSIQIESLKPCEYLSTSYPNCAYAQTCNLNIWVDSIQDYLLKSCLDCDPSGCQCYADQLSSNACFLDQCSESYTCQTGECTPKTTSTGPTSYQIDYQCGCQVGAIGSSCLSGLAYSNTIPNRFISTNSITLGHDIRLDWDYSARGDLTNYKLQINVYTRSLQTPTKIHTFQPFTPILIELSSPFPTFKLITLSNSKFTPYIDNDEFTFILRLIPINTSAVVGEYDGMLPRTNNIPDIAWFKVELPPEVVMCGSDVCDDDEECQSSACVCKQAGFVHNTNGQCVQECSVCPTNMRCNTDQLCECIGGYIFSEEKQFCMPDCTSLQNCHGNGTCQADKDPRGVVLGTHCNCNSHFFGQECQFTTVYGLLYWTSDHYFIENNVEFPKDDNRFTTPINVDKLSLTTQTKIIQAISSSLKQLIPTNFIKIIAAVSSLTHPALITNPNFTNGSDKNTRYNSIIISLTTGEPQTSPSISHPTHIIPASQLSLTADNTVVSINDLYPAWDEFEKNPKTSQLAVGDVAPELGIFTGISDPYQPSCSGAQCPIGKDPFGSFVPSEGNPTDPKDGGLSTGALVGVIIAVIVCIIGVFIILFIWARWCKRHERGCFAKPQQQSRKTESSELSYMSNSSPTGAPISGVKSQQNSDKSRSDKLNVDLEEIEDHGEDLPIGWSKMRHLTTGQIFYVNPTELISQKHSPLDDLDRGDNGNGW